MSSDSSPPRRHWNGLPGARHEHQNVWINGGPRSPAPKPAWYGWDEAWKTRRASDSSTLSASSTGSNSSTNGSKASKPFEKLQELKRNLPHHQTNEFRQRKMSWDDQIGPQRKGLLASWWNGYVRGQ
ncbi:hypothetical protein VTN31DRAFT_6762 [Thermomyces dupontii]|uniref:uncharacterized protein n=1 Tax=Talaromyces thermophilus TaxID=28565 RepID=UPI00374264FD